MKLISLALQNFKGRTFTLDAGGQNLNVLGDNATGKSTLFDAFLWLLFGKDSQGRADFKIKNLDADGNETHNLEHTVEGAFEISGKMLTLKKVFAEKWTKKRGSATAEFTGHETSYWIDKVPRSKKEYDSYIATISDEFVFKLLTSPTHFNEQLHWQQRRELLLKICGNISDAEVIDSAVTIGNKDMLSLLNVLNSGRSLDDYRKIILARRSEINKELEKIPVRIDEATLALPNIKSIIVEELPTDMTKLRGQIADKQAELSRIESGGQIAELRVRLREAEGQVQQQRNEFDSNNAKLALTESKRLNDAISKTQVAQTELEGTKRRIFLVDSDICAIEASLKNLRELWQKAYEKELVFNQADSCPTCGQSIPEEQLQAARDKAQADFNQAKAEELEAITNKGKTASADLAKLKQQRAEFETLQSQQETVYQQALSDEKSIRNNPAKLPEFICNNTEIDRLQAEIAKLQASSQESVFAVRSEIETLQMALRSLEQAAAKVEQYKQGQQRISDLAAQQKALASEFERLEGELYLTDEFMRTKVNLLESRINSKFKLARFKLFEQQVNGGLQECCETTYNGVPYGGGLNNGHKIIVGMDIIRTLSEYYGFAPVIFIDNAESVTALPEMNAQIIRLVVSKPDKVLRIEADTQESNSLF